MNDDCIDSVTLSVIRARLEVITDEMDVTMFRTALSPVIADSHDACHGIYHPVHGGTVAQGAYGHPIFVGAMSRAVRYLLERRESQSIQPGDVFLINDPYIAGTHVQDVKVIVPVFVDGEIFCYMGGCGHWTDIGGPAPGNWNPSAGTIFQEGLRIPLVKIVSGGVLLQDVLDVVVANVRLPTWAASDLQSEIQVLSLGARGIGRLCEEYGAGVVRTAIDTLITRTAAMLRQQIREVPDGTYSFQEFLDNDGVTAEPLELNVDVVVRGDELTLDFSRTTQRGKGPYNISRATLEAACFVAIKHVFAEVPANAGVMDAVRIVTAADSFLCVEWPAAVGAYTEVSLRVIDAISGAMARAIPELLWGCAFNTVGSLVLSGQHEGQTFVSFLYFGGGLGGSPRGDGMNHSASALSNSYIASVEMVEARFPFRFHQWALRPDSGGDGEFRGGLGSIYELELLCDAAESFFVGERAVFPPYGVMGGRPGASTVLAYRLGGTDFVPPLKSKAERIPMKRGDRVTVRTPGGGGYGDPSRRGRAAIEFDRVRGYVTHDRN
ncbi:MAG: hydantoinase B/oxoprolinase family protein [Burkholderiaceae bacterium]|nr:hydantoinase B/oxoprolinase family protein [Burkholderiaceae bacterium]